jgi:predicted RNA binding protein YcfA (HicA-like mRNA interferase family)
MPRLPRLSARQVVGVFETLGWQVVRQSSSHIILVREGHNATLSVPNHKQVALGTLRSLIRAADLTVAEFVAARRRA